MLRWIFLLLLVPYALGLSSVGLFESEETRYAEMAKEMLQSGDWLVPRMEGGPYLEKPPLTVWATALVFRAFGISEFTARIVPLLSALALVFFTYRIARRLGGPSLALTTCVILAGSPLLFGMARILATDAPFAAAVLAAIDALLALRERREFLRQLQLGLAVAASLLIKGPLGPLLIALGAASISWQDRSWKTLLESLRPIPVLVIAGASVPWFYAIQKRYPDFLDFFLLRHHFARFLGVEAHDHDLHPEPIYYFLPVLAGMAMPWMLRLGAALGAMSKLPDPRLWRAMWFWALSMLLFFSLGAGKRIPYLLPLLPPLAIVLALGWHALRTRKLLAGAALATAGCMAAVALLLPRFEERVSLRPIAGETAKILRSETRRLVVFPSYFPGVSFYAGRGAAVYGSLKELGFADRVEPGALTIELLDEARFNELLAKPGKLAVLGTCTQIARRLEQWGRKSPMRVVMENKGWTLVEN